MGINMVISDPTYDLGSHGCKNARPMDRCVKIHCFGILTLLHIMCSWTTIIGLGKNLRG